jgi:hypothetical protein
MIFFGAVGIWAALSVSSTLRRTRDWPSVNGTILERGVGEAMSQKHTFMPLVKYRYEVNGKSYTNDQVYTIRRTGNLAPKIRELVDGLPNPVPVFYDPADPSQSYLLRNSVATYWLLIGFSIFVCLLGSLTLLTAIFGKRS